MLQVFQPCSSLYIAALNSDKYSSRNARQERLLPLICLFQEAGYRSENYPKDVIYQAAPVHKVIYLLHQ